MGINQLVIRKSSRYVFKRATLRYKISHPFSHSSNKYNIDFTNNNLTNNNFTNIYFTNKDLVVTIN